MKAMILAAGRGSRMRPLTDQTHKGLLKVGGRPLIEHHLLALAKMGIKDVVINLSYLADQLKTHLGDGSRFGVNIHYSLEAQPLEVGGGIINALTLLGDEPFITINCDIWTDYPLESLADKLTKKAHLVLIDNPKHNLQGDFAIVNNLLKREGEPKYTFSGIAIYHPEIFHDFAVKPLSLLEILKNTITNNLVTAEHYQGAWHDIGTPERLAVLNAMMIHSNSVIT